MEKRLGLLVIPEEAMLEHLRIVPEILDLRLVHANYSFTRQAIVLTLASSEFAPVPEGGEIPVLNWARKTTREISILTREKP